MSDRAEQLCERAKAGDLPAASELLGLFYERIFGYFRRLAGRDEDAADLTQKTFVRVWASLAGYEGRASFSTWLHRIAYCAYVDWRRAKDRFHAQTDAWWEARIANGQSPFEDAVERETAHRLYAAVEQLDEPAREAIHLHYYQGLSLQETAAILEVHVNTVKYRLREALERLRAYTAEPNIKQRSHRAPGESL